MGNQKDSLEKKKKKELRGFWIYWIKSMIEMSMCGLYTLRKCVWYIFRKQSHKEEESIPMKVERRYENDH
jgi:hypothetical protein